ncbi:ATP-binding protein [Aliidiomarina minuta]|uniref:histidine kinase n=1 Tax=Aliidiomarina minuta TaxID=880057 RepID=A0A432W7V4_9GAMM|nr:HAMP domain-containing sensor histidine kinase [Aliidiomarina minuta]RUO26099.1 ATP-binding protein [Aliidiomarina minuta]
MSDKNQAADFSTILGAAVHDMKNSLWLLLQNIEEVAADLEGSPAARSLADIQYEAQRLNTGLVQLLSLYRNEQDALPVNLEEQFIDELVEELIAENEFYAKRHNIELQHSVEAGLTCFMDKSLITVLLQDVVINGLRYARSKVTIEASREQSSGMLLLRVSDDGEGYPPAMLNTQHQMATADISSGRTGLGLYFAHRIASAHVRQQGCGQITLQNSSQGGSVFELRLP